MTKMRDLRGPTGNQQGWDKVRRLEQDQYLAFAREHAHQNDFCRQIAEQDWVSKKQAGVLRQISTERGWPIAPVRGRRSATVGASSKRRQRRRAEERRDPTVRPKLRQARQMIDDSGREIRLEIDGGVKTDNIGEIAAAGADTFVSGSAIFGSDNYAATIAEMKSEIAAAG